MRILSRHRRVTTHHLLICQHLTRQRRLVNLQVNSLNKTTVGRHFVTRFYHHDVAHHHLTALNQLHTTVAHHLHLLLLVHLSEHVELLGGITLKIETDSCSKEDGKNDTYCLNKIVFYKCKSERDGCCHQQDANNGILVFLKI